MHENMFWCRYRLNCEISIICIVLWNSIKNIPFIGARQKRKNNHVHDTKLT